MSRNPPEWHKAARLMRDAGRHVSLIAQKLGKSTSSVKRALDIDNAREKHRNRVRASRGTTNGREPRHVAAKRPKPAKVDVMQIARDFAEGRIDRAELSRRLRGKP
jgi:hypothetical protein